MAECTLQKVVMPGQTNTRGSLFGGLLLAWMDEAAAIAAMRHAAKPVVTSRRLYLPVGRGFTEASVAPRSGEPSLPNHSWTPMNHPINRRLPAGSPTVPGPDRAAPKRPGNGSRFRWRI